MAIDVAALNEIARALVAPAKGILAADESGATIKRRFDSINVESTENSRRDYREMLFRADGSEAYISGVILYDETLRQKAADGMPLVKVLQDNGVIPGIKVDTGAKSLAGADGETVTEGLDGLRERLSGYYALGARFAKWRAVITIGDGIPSDYCIAVNAHALARYAALCQEAGLVPIIEPEVLMDGTHTIQACYDATARTLHEVYAELDRQGIILEGTLLKPNMVLSGKEATDRSSAEEVAYQTIACFQAHVPAAVPGIVFLSGGQADGESVVNLDAINRLAAVKAVPWEISYSYGRGLQAAPLAAWGGKRENVGAAQAVYLQRCREASAARQGQYSAGLAAAAPPSDSPDETS